LPVAFVLAEPGASKFDKSGDRRWLRVLAAAVAELEIGQPRGADLDPAGEIGAVPAHAGAKGDQVLWCHAAEYETSGGVICRR
jgi:hypothetical protein